MAKKIVKVNEEKIRGYMVGDIPDAIENEDIICLLYTSPSPRDA